MAEVIFKGGSDGGFVLPPVLGISSIHGCVNICKPNVKSQTEDFIKSVICCCLAAYLWQQKKQPHKFFPKILLQAKIYLKKKEPLSCHFGPAFDFWC